MNSSITLPQEKEVKELDSFEKGRLFEDYVVTLFNKRKFKLLEWRSDKIASNGVMPESISYPDLEFLVMGKRPYRIAVECKWRRYIINGVINWAKPHQIREYLKFQYQNNVTVLVALGIGGSPSNPERLFVTPLDHMCIYKDIFESHLLPFKRNPAQSIDDSEQLKLF